MLPWDLNDAGFWGRGPEDGATERLARYITDAVSSPERNAHLGAVSLTVFDRAANGALTQLGAIAIGFAAD